MKKIAMVSASQSGRTRSTLWTMKEELKNEVEIDSYDAVTADLRKVFEADIIILASYTYDELGRFLPEEMIEFMEGLLDYDLSEKLFVIVGTGNSFDYPHFAYSAMELASLLQSQKTTILKPYILVDQLEKIEERPEYQQILSQIRAGL